MKPSLVCVNDEAVDLLSSKFFIVIDSFAKMIECLTAPEFSGIQSGREVLLTPVGS